MKHGGLHVFFGGHLCGGGCVVFFCLIKLNFCRLSYFSVVFHMCEETGEHSLEYQVTICQDLLTPCLFKCKHVLPRHWCWNFCR